MNERRTRPSPKVPGGKGGAVYPLSVIRRRIREHPGPVIDLALGRDRLTPPEWLPQWLRENVGLATRHATLQEIDDFAAEAAAWMRRRLGVAVDPESILVVPGGRAGMNALISTVLEPGDGAVVTEPGYPAFAELVRHHHARVHVVALDAAQGFAPDFSGLSDEQARTTGVVSLNYPNNPTGATFSSVIAADLDRVFGEPLVVFNDGIYAPLTFEGPAISLLADDLMRRDGRSVVELHSLTKPFGLGPLGISFLAGSEPLIAEIRRRGDYAWAPPAALHLKVTARCLRDDDHLDGVREKLRTKVQRMSRVLEGLGFAPYPTASGMYVLCPAPRSVGGRETDTAHAAADVLMDEFGVAVVPWDFPAGYLRFAALHLDEDLAALEALGSRLQISATR